jgi:hypothetical protein
MIFDEVGVPLEDMCQEQFYGPVRREKISASGAISAENLLKPSNVDAPASQTGRDEETGPNNESQLWCGHWSLVIGARRDEAPTSFLAKD